MNHYLSKKLQKKQIKLEEYLSERMEIFDLSKINDQMAIEVLFKKKLIHQILNPIDSLLKELMFIESPQVKTYPISKINSEFKSFVKKKRGNLDLIEYGRWIFYPWNKTLVHTLDKKDYNILRTNRNKFLITKEEQKNFYNFNVGIIGLSVGQNIAYTIAQTGGAKNLKLSDSDLIELTNLNRIRAGLININEIKSEYIAEKIYELNPFSNILIFKQNVSKESIKNFILKDFPLNIIIDEFDDIKVKIYLREIAKELKIPVLMATDLENGVLIDIERYDTETNLEIFHGLFKNNFIEKLKTSYERKDFIKASSTIIGQANIPSRLNESLKLIGTELTSVPQLGIATNLAASILTYCIIKISNNKPLPSQRTLIKIEDLMRD